MITTEQAFDMMPNVVGIYEKLKIRDFAQKRAKELVKKYPTEPTKEQKHEMSSEIGAEIVAYILKESPRAKEDFFGMVAIACGVTVEEAKAQSPAKSFKVFKELISDPELMDFFSEAMK